MNQVLITVLIGYGIPYIVSYGANYAFKTAVKKTAKEVSKKIFDKKIECEYELILLDEDGNAVTSSATYVTSASTIDQSWSVLESDFMSASDRKSTYSVAHGNESDFMSASDRKSTEVAHGSESDFTSASERKSPNTESTYLVGAQKSRE